MKTTLFVCLLFANGLSADTVVTVPLLANLGNSGVDGSALLLVHEVLDGSGNLKSGSIEFSINYPSGGATITGVEVRSGNAAIVLASGASTPAGQAQFGTAAGQPSLITVQDMLANPANYFVSFNAGAIRGQVLPAQTTVLMGLMSGVNANPSGGAGIVVLRAFDASGNLTAALISADLSYTGFASGTLLTGLDIAGLAATGVRSLLVGRGGSGILPAVIFITPSDQNFTAEVTAVNGLCANPSGYSINLRTAANPAGEIRGPLRSTGMARFQLDMLPQNETPPVVPLNASAPAALTVYTTRSADGTAAAAYVFFEVNARFPGPATFTGLDINSGAAGATGAVAILTEVDSDPIATGTGNISIFGPEIVADAAGVQAVNALLQNPAGFYLNLRSKDAPGGAARAQLSEPLGTPSIDGVASASSSVLTVAPGSLVSIYGHNLSAVTSDLSGIYQLTELPGSLDGVSVTIGGVRSPISYVSAEQINAQVPFEAEIGSSGLAVTTATGTATYSIGIARVAPSIFIVDAANSLGAVVKGSDFSLITPNNPVKGGEAVVIYATGFGQTSPPVATGIPVAPPGGGAFNNTPAVTVTIGGRDAMVLYSIAAPGFAGLYQTAALVPAGISGSVPLVLNVGSVSSNAPSIAVR